MLIYDPEGGQSFDLPLSYKQRMLLEAGAEVTISYHTPQLMLGLIGRRSGQITVKQHDGRVVASKLDAFREFRSLRAAIEAIQKQRENK